MSLLEPLWLLLAAAAAVPLLLHLMRRRSGVRVDFPAVRYLARAEREHSKRLRLRNILLMLVRVLALLLVALAAARPLARLAGVGHAPTALAIVIDNSLSSAAIVDGRPVLARLQAEARVLLARAAPGDRLWLVTADGAVRAGDARAVRAAIDAVQPLAGAGNPSRAVTRAAALVGGSGLRSREVALLTDGQATSWPARVALGDVQLALFAAPGAPPRNHAVVAATPRPPRWTPGGTLEIGLVAEARDSVGWRAAIEGPDGAMRTIGRGVSAGGAGAAALAVTPAARGWIRGMVEVEPDELRGDDRRAFAVWAGDAPAVSVAPAAGPFARAAVDALVASGRARAGAGAALVPADEAARLPALILAPAERVRLGAANRALERLGIPWRFGAERRDSAEARGGPGGPAIGTGVRVASRWTLERRGDVPSDTIATAGGTPWIVGGPGYVLVASALLPEATSFPVRASFAPWLADVLAERLSAVGEGSVVLAAPGDSVRLVDGVSALEAPGGARLPLAAAWIAAPDSPGVYFLLRGERRAGALVVNPEAEESVLERATVEQLRQRFAGARVRATSDAPAWRGAFFSARGGRPLVLPLLLAAAAALLLESLLTRPRRQPRAA